MPRFLSSSQLGAVIADGVYALKVTKATEKVSERGNPMIVMALCLPDGRSLGCVLTFVEAAKPVTNAFCEWANLQRPPGDGVEVELTAAHSHGSYLYATIFNDIRKSVSLQYLSDHPDAKKAFRVTRAPTGSGLTRPITEVRDR